MKSLPSLQVYTKILELIDTHSGGLSLSEIANLLDLPKKYYFLNSEASGRYKSMKRLSGNAKNVCM